MFENIETNVEMLKGAYLKYKSYYYYNKNLLMMRKKIAEFEKMKMIWRTHLIALHLCCKILKPVGQKIMWKFCYPKLTL